MNTIAFNTIELETETKEVETVTVNSGAIRELLDAELLYVGGGSGEVIVG